MNQIVNIKLENLQSDVLQDILVKSSYQDLNEFNKYNPDFRIQLNIPAKSDINLTTISNNYRIHRQFLKKIKEKKKALNGFNFINYKNCLLVKHHRGLDNPNDVSTKFVRDGFSRPMWWNATLDGWVASTKDEDELTRLGAYKYTNTDL